jgi:hypothetical protein
MADFTVINGGWRLRWSAAQPRVLDVIRQLTCQHARVTPEPVLYRFHVQLTPETLECLDRRL